MIVLLVQTLLLVAAILAAYWLTIAVGRRAAIAGRRWGVVSEVSHRSSHTRPTSRLGGVALAAGIFLPATVFTAALWWMPRSEIGWGGNIGLLGALAAGAVAMFAVGLADDLWDLPPLMKLLGEAAALTPLVLTGFRFLSLEVAPAPGVPPDLVLTLLCAAWILFFVNAFNFMDGMDGYAARFARHVCLWLFALGVAKTAVSGDLLELRIEFLLIVIVGAAASGFYRLNRPPAQLFMGDSGSLLLGYLLAVQVVLADGGYYSAWLFPPEPGMAVSAGAVWLLLLPFIFDVVLTVVRRASRRENLLAAHRGHLYQRLLKCGMSHGQVLALNARYFRATGAIGFAYAFMPSPLLRLGLWAAALAAMSHYWRLVTRAERGGGLPIVAGARGRERDADSEQG